MLYAPVEERITKKRPGHYKYADQLNHALTSAPTSIRRLTRRQDKLAHSTGVVYRAADATVTGSLSWRLAQIMDRRALHYLLPLLSCQVPSLQEDDRQPAGLQFWLQFTPVQSSSSKYARRV
jgi:hypothetical protein